MNINIKKAITATAVIASIVIGGAGCATNNANNGKDNGKSAQPTAEQPKDTQSQTPAPAPTTPAPTQSGPDDSGKDNGAVTNKGGTTFTQTLTEDEARALDEQGLRGGVIGRENGLTVTRDGNVLTFTVDKDANVNGGTVVAASDTKKSDANTADSNTPADSGDNDGGSVVNPGIVTPGIVNPGDNDGPGIVNPGNPGNNIGDGNNTFVPNPGPAPAPNPGSGDTEPAPSPAPTPEPEINHSAQAAAFMQTFRAKYIGLINKARADLGLKPLVASEQLTNSAQTWASRSAEDGLGGAHYSDWKSGENGGKDLAGVTSFKRENVSDITATSGGYIGDANNTADAIADRLFNQTINQDPEQRKTVLDKDADRIGIGVSEAVIDGYLDSNGNAVHTDHKSQAIKTVVQTGNSANASQVGADDKVVEYVSENTQKMDSVSDDKFNTALPPVEGTAPAAETPAPTPEPAPAEPSAPAETPAPVTPAPTEAATPSTPAETPAPVAEQPATSATPVEHTVPAATASTPDTGVALGVGE